MTFNIIPMRTIKLNNIEKHQNQHEFMIIITKIKIVAHYKTTVFDNKNVMDLGGE